MGRRAAVAVMALGLGTSACAAKPPPRPQETPARVAEPYRPGWTAGIALHINEIRLCLAERPPPTAVVHVQALATGATGVTAVDGLGQVENCAAHDGRVVMRAPAELEAEDLEGLPLFSLAPGEPRVAPGVLVEDVEDDAVVLGWLYWPTGANTSGAPLAD